MSGVNEHISYYRFRNAKCRVCIYLHRYRHTHTKDRFKEPIKRFNIKVKPVFVPVFVFSQFSWFFAGYPRNGFTDHRSGITD